MTDYPHDALGDEDRISPEEHRNPRCVVVDEFNGTRSWGELSNGDCAEVMDTTLKGFILDAIEKKINDGQYAGSIEIDEITYLFVYGKH